MQFIVPPTEESGEEQEYQNQVINVPSESHDIGGGGRSPTLRVKFGGLSQRALDRITRLWMVIMLD